MDVILNIVVHIGLQLIGIVMHDIDVCRWRHLAWPVCMGLDEYFYCARAMRF